MDPPDRTVDSGGGAVFRGDITAGRDITINQITEIRQATERLSSRCIGADASDKFLGSLEALSAAAEFTEDYARELGASVFASDSLRETVSQECASISSELKRLENSLGRDGNGTYVITASFSEDVVDVRSRLMSLQMHLSNVNSRKTAKDFETIKEAVTQLMNNHQSSDDASSIRSFFTAASIPYVERQIWQEIEKALRERFTTEYVRDNYALIVASVEELVSERALAKPDPTPPEASNIMMTGTTLRLSEEYNIYIDPDVENSVSDDDASLRALYGDRKPYMSDIDWTRSVEEGTGTCILTLDGGGVKSCSSILIIEALMEEVIACENRFERAFTHHPRTFKASEFRPCHYFHKMYGTSTGGMLAIAMSRLRMTVSETITMFTSLLHNMYGYIRGRLPLATKYHHLPLKHVLNDMAKRYCKQHGRDLCSEGEKFRWRPPGYGTDGYEDDSNDSAVLHDLGLWRDPPSKESKLLALEQHTPEYHLCQTICVTAVHSGQIDEAYMLRTYTHHYDPDTCPPWVTPYNRDTLDLEIWQVGRATTATPLLFEMLVAFGPEGHVFMKDGGIRENNPSYCAYSEAASLSGDDNQPSILLSIGAGHTKSTSDDFSESGILPSGLSSLTKFADRLAVFKNVLIKYSAGQDRHKMMHTIARGGHTWYKRFEVINGLESMKADQWEHGSYVEFNNGEYRFTTDTKTLSTIRTATEAYLSRQEPDKRFNEYAAPREMLKQTAEKLVRMRRARELEAMTQGGEKREHWEAFMGKHLIGEQDFFRKYQEEWDYALLGRKN